MDHGLPLSSAVSAVEQCLEVGSTITTTTRAVFLRGRDVLSGEDGVPILREISKNAFVCEENGALILGASTTDGDATAQLDLSLGELAAKRFLALGRTSLWWMTPAWGCKATEIPVETQFMLLELETAGSFALLLPLLNSVPGTGTFRATLRSAGRSRLGLRIESGAASVVSSRFPSSLLIVSGRDPFEVITRGVAVASSLSGTARPRVSKAVPPIANLFGWCTWDAFYSTVSAAGIMSGLDSLVKGGVPPSFLIIDDGWQQTDVDPDYRNISGDANAGDANARDADCDDGFVSSSSLKKKRVSYSMAEIEAAEHKAQEATAEFLAAEGDPAPEQMRGENRLEDENITTYPGGGIGGIIGTAIRFISLVILRLEAIALHLGKHILDSSHSGSLVVRVFSALATGPLRPALLRFFAHSSDHCRRLTSIEANAKFSLEPDAVPQGQPNDLLNAPGGDLGSVVSEIKRQFGVKFVYAWHAMGAFWGGLGVNDPGVAKYSPQLLFPTPTPSILEADPAVAWVQPVLAGVSLPLDPTELHNDMHAYLASNGVDGVKVDVQGTIGLAGSAVAGGPSLAAAYHASLEASATKHFSGHSLINCMCHSTENLYHMAHSNLARVSDDFYPSRPASHTAHIGNCAFNSLFIGEIVGVDWDMFHSNHPAALLHATARAISGGPVYISDRPGNHNFDLLRRLVLADGSTLRCSFPGRPTADCLFSDVSRDGATVLKVWNTNAVTGVVGVFNIQGSTFSRAHRAFHTHDHSPPTLKTIVRPGDVPALRWVSSDEKCTDGDGSGGTAETNKDERLLCALYSDTLGEFKIVDGDSNGGLELVVPPNGGCDVVTLSPVSVAGNVLFAPIGLTEFLNAGGAVLESRLKGNLSRGKAEAEGEGDLVEARLTLRGSGTFLAYASHRPTRVTVRGAEVEFTYDASASALRFTVTECAEVKACVVKIAFR